LIVDIGFGKLVGLVTVINTFFVDQQKHSFGGIVVGCVVIFFFSAGEKE